ncbi:MAG: tetratricopeptide repeat protein [Treponema sp.]|jgi:tetratricopeptide (TPR) repeat protein|nr:tetratricopeptide repeat protein [Treponema sp.]
MKKKAQNKADKFAPFISRRESRIPALIITLLVVISFAITSFYAYRFIRVTFIDKLDTGDLYALWSNGDYQSVFSLSDQLLEQSPFDNSVRTLHGFSSFWIAVSETDPLRAQTFLDTAINSMRIALYSARKTAAPQIEYMLGKAYYYKDSLSAYHYYADLVVKYLLAAREKGYQAEDMAEYLGLSYAALGMTEKSIAYFTEALQYRDSDVLALAVAEQYCKAGLYAEAEPYLLRLAVKTGDEALLFKSRSLLGQIYFSQRQFDRALVEYQAVLEKDPASADAYYGIGLIYEELGDAVLARAQWRRALQIHGNHPGALQKMAGAR